MKFLKKEIPIPRFFSLLLLFSTIVIPTCLISYLIHSYNFDYGKLNNIGGTFVFLNPIVAMFAALITYCAFYVQYQANKTIIEENKKERVINRFYELLRTHKENVNELKADDYIYEYEDVICDNHWKNHIRLKKSVQHKGRKAFVCYLSTINDLFKFYNEFLERKPISPPKKELDKIIFVYNYFFSGPTNKESCLFYLFVKEKMEQIVENRNQSNTTINDTPNIEGSFLSEHKTELNHYYRHLYMMVKYIDQIDEAVLSYPEKRDLLRTLRAQLTTKEQVMLFYNWLSRNGSQWEKQKNDKTVDNSFFIKYRMIHNITLEDLIFLHNRPLLEKAKEFVSFIKMVCEKDNLPSGKNFLTEKRWDPVFQFEDVLDKRNVGFDYKN